MNRQAMFLIAIVLLALNLRPAMAGLGPVLDLIEATTGMTSAEAGMLTTLPVFLMGVGAFGGRYIRLLIGTRNGITLAITLIALACAGRLVWGSWPGMITTAAVAGLGIAAVQALVPGEIKGRFGNQTGQVMGLYTTGIMAGAAFAAAMAAGLANHFGWQVSLAIWAIPAMAATVIWLIQPAATEQPATIQTAASPSFFRIGRAWLLMVFFGVGTGAYTLVLAWLPPFYMELGQSRAVSGYLLAGLTMTEVVAGLTVSALIGRFPDRRGPLLAMLLCLLTGLICLIFAPGALAIPAVILLGIGIGALFPLSLIVALDHVDDPVRAGELASFVQGGGYMIASTMPFLAGIIRDRFTDLSQAWVIMAAGTVLLFILALRFSPESCRIGRPDGVSSFRSPEADTDYSERTAISKT